MKYNKETRNEEGKFYRVGDWGMMPIRDESAYTNFTEVVPPQETLEHGVPCDWNGSEWVLDGSAYKQKRAEAYASKEEQLDMQYWDATNGTTTWLDHIAEVKSTHPKPGA